MPDSTKIRIGDPRHEAALNVLVAMHKFWDTHPSGGAVRWIEDTSGRLVIFTRGEYKDKILESVIGNEQPTEQFETLIVERDGYDFTDEEEGFTEEEGFIDEEEKFHSEIYRELTP